jgi:hypothetical protein
MTKDGLAWEYKDVQFLSGTNLSFATASGLLPFPTAYTGSPVVGNLTIQTGQVSGAGIANAVVVSFGAPFAAAPISVQLTAAGSTALANQQYVAGATAGSFVFNAAGSNTTYYWTAIGSGRL